MKFFFKFLLAIVITVIFLATSYSTYAATLKSGESVYLSEEEANLSDLYLFGSSITSDALVENDLTAVGGTITLNGKVTGSILTAGGDIFVRSDIGNTLRAVGGNVIVSGEIKNDVLIAGGNIRLNNTASISGDLLITGGDIQIDSPVEGKIYINGGRVTINNKVGGNIEGNIGNLILGNKARLEGNLSYIGNEKAIVTKGAIIKGKHEFISIRESTSKPKESFISGRVLYKLAIDIIISLMLLALLPIFTKTVLEKAYNTPITTLSSGFLFVVFWPLISIFLLFFIWLGIASFLLYGLILLTSLFLGKIFLGWWILNQWNKHEKKEYFLDWKAAIVGPFVFFILFLIPIIGWIVAFTIYFIAAGGVIQYILDFIKSQKNKS